MHHGIDQRLKQRLVAVLWQVDARRLLARCNLHVSHRKGYRIGNLPVQRTGNFLCVNLTGSPVSSPVAGCRNAGVREPLLGISGAQQHASYRGAWGAGLIGQQ